MAIEIISKSKLKAPSLSLLLIIVCVIIVAVFVSVYFFFTINLRRMGEEIQKKEQATIALTRAIMQKEAEIIPLKNKISDYGLLLNMHKSPLDIFKILEDHSLPKVWFSNFSFDIKEKQVVLLGHTDSFEILEQQVSILKEESLITEIALSNVSMAEEGGIDFILELSFSPEVFNPTF